MSQVKEVALFTFFAHIGYKGAKIPITPLLEHLPHDWPELKEHLRDRAEKAFENYGVIEAWWTLEKHVSTRRKVWRPTIRSYRYRPFCWARDVLASFVVAYDPNSRSVTVRQASFSPTISFLSRDFREIERNKKYEIAPLIPKSFKSFLENPKQIVQEHSALRYPDYSRHPKFRYEREARPFHTPPKTYAPFGERVKSQD